MENSILARVAEATIDAPVKLEVDIKPQNRWHKFFMKNGLSPTKRKFELTGVTMGTLIRIARKMLEIDIDFFDPDTLLDGNYKALDQHGRKIAECVALCVHNKKSELPGELVEFILENFTAEELKHVLTIVLKKMDIQSFMTTIISLRGMNILATRTASAQPVNDSEVSL